METQTPLFISSIEEALKEAVRLMGGAKTVGQKLRPDQLADDAGGWLSNCLNPSKRDKLSPAQIIWLLREARKAGHHVAMEFICENAGYEEPRPLKPETEKEKLQREYIAAVRQNEINIENQRRNIERLEQFNKTGALRIA